MSAELHEHLVYVALVDHPDDGVADLAARLDLTTDQVRQALDSLASISLLTLADGGRPSLTGVSHSVALSAIVARQEATLSEQRARLADAQAAVERWLTSRVEEPCHKLVVEQLDDLDEIRARISKLAGDCREELWSLNPDGAQTPENIEASRAPNLELLERGIAMRSIFNDSARNDPDTAAHLRWLSDHGADVRTTPMLSLRMLLVDRHTAIVPMDERDSSAGAYVVQGRGLVSGLTTLFLTTWRTATPLGVRRTAEPDRPTATEMQALVLWGLGCTDTVVAKRLGVSERTVRRLSEQLATRLGARSRFEMGVRATELGWITSDDLLV